MFCFRAKSGQEMTTLRVLRSTIAAPGGHVGGHSPVNCCSVESNKGLQNLYSAVPDHSEGAGEAGEITSLEDRNGRVLVDFWAALAAHFAIDQEVDFFARFRQAHLNEFQARF